VIPESWLDLLDESIRHRGPDGEGRFRDRAVRADGSVVDVALVHRRLSIIDPAGGEQPMVSQGGRPGHGEGPVAVVFNGCLYNHRDLRARLERAGHAFQTDHSDTEVLIHGWREWGTSLPQHLEGMFAFALWDRAKHQLFIARDFYGEKPLYTLDGRVFVFEPEYEATRLITCAKPGEPMPGPIPRPYFAFASTNAAIERIQSAAALCRHGPDRARDPADAAADLQPWFTHGYASKPPGELGVELAPASWELLGNERCGPSGEFVVDGAEGEFSGRFAPSALGPTPVQTFGGRTPPQPGTLTPSIVENLLRQAVGRRIEADVPLGCFLSGGVDSSLVALFAHQAAGPLQTFCVRMPDPRYDESAIAEHVAGLIGTCHTTLECDADPANDLVMLIEQLGLPFGDSSLLPAYWVSRAARRHVKVALTGDGGDELFAGYERYMAHGVLRRWGWLLSLIPSDPLPARDPKSRWSKLARLARAARGGGAEDLALIFDPLQVEKLFGQTGSGNGPRHWSGPEAALGNAMGLLHGSFSSLLSAGLEYLSGDLLRKMDTASMSVALETRAPFLDSHLTAAVHAANPADLIPHGRRKGLLRQVARGHFPATTVDRPKMGFAIPVGDWFRTDYGGMKTLLMDHLGSSDPWPDLTPGIDRAYVRRLVDEHMSAARDHSQRLYALLVLSIWAMKLRRPH